MSSIEESKAAAKEERRTAMGKLKIQRMVLGPVRTNCYLAVNQETKECFVVDPADMAGLILTEIKEENLTARAVLLTHGHYDHIGAAEELRTALKIPIYASEMELPTLADTEKNLSAMFGHPMTVKADRGLKDGEVLGIAGFSVQVFQTPGHTPGGACYYLEEEKTLFSGDTLFAGSVGRSDFPGGSARTLQDSVRRLFRELPEDTNVYPGHESETDIGYEKRYNPYA